MLFRSGGRETSGTASVRPALTGTAWVRQDPPLDFADLDSPATIDVDLLDAANTVLFNEVIALWPDDAGRPADLAHLRTQIQATLASSARPELAGVRVLLNDDRITVVPGGSDPSLRVRFNSGPTAGAVDLTTNAQMNVAAYQLGIGPVLEAQSDPVPGAVMARFAVDELHATRLAILFDFKQDYSVGLAEFFRETAQKLGAEIVADERYTSGDIEFRAPVEAGTSGGVRPGAFGD